MQTACLDASSGGAATEKGSKLLIGWASTDITPEKPAALAGTVLCQDLKAGA